MPNRFHCDSAADAQELATYFRDNDILAPFHLHVGDLTRDAKKGVAELGKSLSQLSKLTSVNLKTNFETWERFEGAADLLVGYLGENDNVNELSLESVRISKGFVKFLRSKWPRLLHLELIGCSIDPQMLGVICCAFRNSNIQSIDISPSYRSSVESTRDYERRSEDFVGVLRSVLQRSQGSNAPLRKLRLDFNWDPVASRIPGLVRDFLLQNQTMESLRLDASLNHASLFAVAEGIRGNYSLKELDLSNNYGISSVGPLMSALMQRPKPLGLILGRPALGDIR